MSDTKKRIAIIGGGPSGLFMFKQLIESGQPVEISIFEKSGKLGAGMPYSNAGANEEHVTNVSDNEIPSIVSHVNDWISNSKADLLRRFNIDPQSFNEYKVMPRLFFGEYLSGQFNLLLEQAKQKEIPVQLFLQHAVKDVTDDPDKKEICIQTEKEEPLSFDVCVIATGHHWPLKYEKKVKGYFDSPYPPSKLRLQANHTVAIRGTSLTAIDAIRTLARSNGCFEKNENEELTYTKAAGSDHFKIRLHSRNGLLPAIRFHMEEPRIFTHVPLTPDEIATNRAENDGFLSLDFVFENAFKKPLQEKEPGFYKRVKDLRMEAFVDFIMEYREKMDPFVLFRSEYAEAEKSIHQRKSIYWKELLAILSFAMNYPAKHFSAEDMLRLNRSLSQLITIVIAFIPQNPAAELLALHAAGVIDIIAVGETSRIEPHEEEGIIYHYTDEKNHTHADHYRLFIDCIGQPPLSVNELPFKTLVKEKTVSQAYLKFKNQEAGKAELEKGEEEVKKEGEKSYYLKVPGIAINDNFQVVDAYGAYNDRIYMMAVPYMSGYNPDYSGLDFCEKASGLIVKSMFKEVSPPNKQGAEQKL